MKLIKRFFISFFVCVGLVLMCFPLALGKGGGNANGNYTGERVESNGEFAFIYQDANPSIFRGIGFGHVGIDYNGYYGAKLVALTDAVVYKASQTCAPNGGYLGNFCPFDEVAGGGNYVVLRFTYDQKDFFVQYDHLSRVYVKTGDIVKKGDLIGEEGHSGNSTGSHLHLEAHYGGVYSGSMINLVDPTYWFEQE